MEYQTNKDTNQTELRKVQAIHYYIEKVLAKQYDRTRVAKALAWSHLILMNVGTTVATGMLMYAGYLSGAAI
jgi:amino acid permease